jgi:uncharacterized protein YcfJ
MKTQIKTIILAVGFAVSAAASSAYAADFDDFARVVSVAPQVEQANQPRQQCWTEQVQVQQRPQRSAGGAILGGLAGGLLGSQVGGGNGRIAAAAVGAMTGAVVGDRLDNDGNPVVAEQPVQRCRTVDHWESRNNGYAVTYEYRGHTYTSIMPYEPGERMKVHVSVVPRP